MYQKIHELHGDIQNTYSVIMTFHFYIMQFVIEDKYKFSYLMFIQHLYLWFKIFTLFCILFYYMALLMNSFLKLSAAFFPWHILQKIAAK